MRGEMRPLSAPVDCPPELVELCARCMAEEPEQRPTAKEVAEVLASLIPRPGW